LAPAVRPDSERPRLSIVIPAFNESARLASTLAQVLSHVDAHYPRCELVLVDDGSTDETWDIIARAESEDDRVRGVRHPGNLGKGAAVRNGLRASRGDVVVFFDADLPFPLENIAAVVASIEGGADLAIGARDLDPERESQENPLLRQLSSFAFNWTVERFLSLGINDTQCGFKAFRGPVARQLAAFQTIDGFGFDVELLYVARRWGLTIDRIPLHHVHQEGSSVRVVRDGLRMLNDLIQTRRNARQGKYPEQMPDATAAK
jgi:glycosyltransferase involved in cell wall biosynthesis